MKTVFLAQGVNAEQVGSITHDDDAGKMVGPGNAGQSGRGFRGIAALRFGDDGCFGNAVGEKIIMPYPTFRMRISRVSAAKGNDQWRQTALV